MIKKHIYILSASKELFLNKSGRASSLYLYRISLYGIFPTCQHCNYMQYLQWTKLLVSVPPGYLNYFSYFRYHFHHNSVELNISWHVDIHCSNCDCPNGTPPSCICSHIPMHFCTGQMQWSFNWNIFRMGFTSFNSAERSATIITKLLRISHHNFVHRRCK
jgi:hypothetical protein